ncbi:MAG: Uma2 family endonuclease [Bryobacteraceae bacterium]
MSTAVHISMEEYLNTEYEPDCDYVDGTIEERNVGKNRHSRTQTLLSSWLLMREMEHGHKVLVEQRVRVSPSRVRIPDICLVGAQDIDEVIQEPPALCVEILSPDDRWNRIQDRLTDLLGFGVPTIWIIDPYTREAWIATSAAPVAPATDGKLRCAALKIELELNEILPEE